MMSDPALRLDATPGRPGHRELVKCCIGAAATPWRLARPRHRDEALLRRIRDAGVPAARAQVRLIALPQAGQLAPTVLTAEGLWRPVTTRMAHQAFLVEHPRARLLIDPSLDAHGGQRSMPELPWPLRQAVKVRGPVTGLRAALARIGLDPDDVDLALATHLHWDHISGIVELPAGIALHTSAAEFHWVEQGGGLGLNVARRPFAGRELATFELDGPPVLTFARSHDLFGDGSVLIVDLHGHTPGSVGVLLATAQHDRVLLAGDAVWHTRQARRVRPIAPFPGQLADHDRDRTWETIHRLHALPPDVRLVPTHDPEASRPWIPGDQRSVAAS